MASAAFFDLDHTLIPTSSTEVAQSHLRDAGLLSRGMSVPGLFYRAFDLVGENALLVQLDRLGPRAARGWSVAAVARVAEVVAQELDELMLGYGRELLREHRKAGRRVVLATAAPRPLVEAFAARVGFDHVIATEWTIDGKAYGGELDGPMMWGRSKAKAIRNLAEVEGFDLAESYAYSGSFFDAPMLAAVGHPVAVAPDLRLNALASVRRWEIRHFDAPPGVVKIAGRELQELARPFARPEFVPNARIELAGLEQIPASGGAILAANHRSYFDPTVLSLLAARAGRKARFLGKKEVFDVPVLGDLAVAAGGIRVDRGGDDDESLDAAITALQAGDLVIVLPQGTIPRGRAFFSNELEGRWGAARMAAAARVPVIPVGLWGTEAVWPRRSRLPTLRVSDPPLVTATVGRPVDLKYRSPRADTTRIMDAITALLPDSSRIPHSPTAEELAETYPADEDMP